MSQALAFHSSQSDHSYQSGSRIAPPVHPSTLHFTQQVHQLYSLAPYGILASLINSSILVILLWSIVPQGPAAGWLMSVIVVNGAWGFLLYRYKQYSKHTASVDRWSNWFITGNAASGCIWGIGGIILYPSTSIGHEVFLAFVLGGMIAGSTALHASYFPAFLAFCLPTWLPARTTGADG